MVWPPGAARWWARAAAMTRIRPSLPGDAAAILAVVTDAFSDDSRRGRRNCHRSGHLGGAPDSAAHRVGRRRRWRSRRPSAGRTRPSRRAGDSRRRGRSRLRGVVTPGTGHRLGAGACPFGGRDGGGLAPLGDPGRARLLPRFGFEPAEPLGLSYAPVGAGDPRFQACRLPGYSAAQRGVFSYCWEF